MIKDRPWLTFNIISLVLFLIIGIFLWLRHIDGSGAVMNTELRLLNIAILSIFFAIIWFTEFALFLIINHTKRQ